MIDNLKSIWNIDYTDFPSMGTTRDQILFLLNYAILAPSAHNTQPWQCKIREHDLLVFLDKRYTLGPSDPIKRQTFLSMGCFIANFTSAAKAFAISTNIQWLPRENDLSLVAKIEIIEHKNSENVDIHLLEDIVNRRVNRSIYRRSKITKKNLSDIVDINDDEDLEIKIIESKHEINRIARLIKLGTDFAFKNKKFRHELAEFIIPDISSRKDGIPGYTAGLSFLSSFYMPKIIKFFDVGSSQGQLEEDRFSSSSAVMIIGSTTDEKLSWLRAGYLFEEVAFFLTRKKIAYALTGAGIEPPMVSQKIQKIIQSDFRPQLLVRLGHAKNIPRHSPRRPVSDILMKD